MASVLRTEVVGLQYYSGAVLIEDCKLGDQVSLKRNPKNEIDGNAIEVYLPGGEQVGHIGREDAQYFNSIWDELEERATIIGLEGGLESEFYVLKIAVHADGEDHGLRKGVHTFSYELKDDNQRAYIYVDCSLKELATLKEKLTSRAIYPIKDGECRWRTNDGHKYRWFISVSMGKESFLMPKGLEIEEFFQTEYEGVTRLLEIRKLSNKLASVEVLVNEYEEEIHSNKSSLEKIQHKIRKLNEQKSELEDFTTLQQDEFDQLQMNYNKLNAENEGRKNKIESLGSEKSRLKYDLSVLGAPEGGLDYRTTSLSQYLENTFPRIEFLRDSFQKINSIESPDLLPVIGRSELDLNGTGKSGWKNFSAKGWREHYFSLGGQKTGRLYAFVDKKSNTIKLLVSDKASQDRDSKYIYKLI